MTPTKSTPELPDNIWLGNQKMELRLTSLNGTGADKHLGGDTKYIRADRHPDRQLIEQRDAIALPVSYRPLEYDDWGVIRDANGKPVCQIRYPLEYSEEKLNEHRANGTDPYEKASRLVVAALNSVARATGVGE